MSLRRCRKTLHKSRITERGHSISELPVALFIFLFLILFPLIDLLSIAVACASITLLSHQAASRAAAQQNFSEALTYMQEDAMTFLASGFANLNKMRPSGGYQNCGLELYTVATDFHTKKVATFGPNTPLPRPPSVLDEVYEFRCNASYEVGPFISMSMIPGLAQVPGLGRSVVLTACANRALEHPDALSTNGNAALGYSAVGAHAPPVNPKAGMNSPSPTDGSWNYPTLYQAIEAAGKKVVSEDVLVVDSNNPNWTISSAVCASGQQVWIDTHADGQWLVGPEGGMTNANGVSPAVYQLWDGMNLDTGWQVGSLLSQVGQSGPVFLAGETLLNYQASSAGPVQFKVNDYTNEYGDNVGTMTVRVIVTQ